MKDDSQSPDNTQEFKLRPSDIVKIREILASRDADGNPRFLDEREVITRALEVFFAWELEPQNFISEIKKIESMKPFQKKIISMLLHEPKSDMANSFLVEDSVIKEQQQQQVDRESKKDYEKMLENLESSKQIIKQMKMSAIKFEYDEKITYDGWPLLWNFYSRLLPAKIAITALGDLVRIEQQKGIKRGLTPNWVLISDLRLTAYDIAEELAEKLRSYERQKKLGRKDKISTGFPKPVIFDKDKPESQGLAEKRFKDKYVVHSRKNMKTGKQHLEGILAAMGLVTVIKIGKEYRISMTDLGKEFYLLDNPVLNGDYTHAFSDDEIEFITGKLIPQRELEDRLYKKALETVSSFDDQENHAGKLDEVFENVIKEFIKSYNGDAVIKERLKKDFGKITEDPDWKDKLKKYQKYLKECKEKEEDPKPDPEMEKLVDLENRLQACRVATMGRLSELGLVNWIIDKNASSIYSIEK